MQAGVYIHTAFGDVVSKAHSIVIMSQPFNFSWSGWSTALRSRRHIGHGMVRIHNYICLERMGGRVYEISVHAVQKYILQHSLTSPVSVEYSPSENIESAFHGDLI